MTTPDPHPNPSEFTLPDPTEHLGITETEPATPENPSPTDEKLTRCEAILDYQFTDKSLLRSALTHASSASHRLYSNERLEFLGDAVLGLTVCQWLYEEYPEYSEGELTKIKSAVVSRRSCGKVATEIGLDGCLIVGRGVTTHRSFPRSLVSDVFEAVVAALYLDGGVEVVRRRLKCWLAQEVSQAVEGRGAINHKSQLQQYAQRALAQTPLYRLVSETGPDHRKRFEVQAVIGDQTFTPAWGNNKKEAEQFAAANALVELQSESGNSDALGRSDIQTEASDPDQSK